MSPDGTLVADRVWKRFRTDRRHSQLRAEVMRLQARLKGETSPGWRWALRDVSMRAEPGDALGIVGVNGSGKSTLLKILTRVMYPYAGSIEVTGRVGALIEVSAGIHPELSGLENVYLYGSLLGLSRAAVSQRFDEIVAFAELDTAIDRQVKFYSSGMKMRLGFAVAAFLEPDVLLVDEVLAVGDATFQQKCLDRMRHVLNQGTTLVFVSHDLAAVEATCTHGVWLDAGTVRALGPIAETVRAYRDSVEGVAEATFVTDGPIRVLKADVKGPDQAGAVSQEELTISLVLEADAPITGALHIGLSEGTAAPIFSVKRSIVVGPGETEVRLVIERLPLPRGRFSVWAGVFSKQVDALPWHPVGHVDVTGPLLDKPPRAVARLAPVHVAAKWEVDGN
jgi:ABC-2 type transport system ATP-binding protein